MPKIEQSPIRDEISSYFGTRIIRIGDPDFRKKSDRFADGIGQIEGIEIVKHLRNFPPGVKCAAYVFWCVLKEPWCAPTPPAPIHPDAFSLDSLNLDDRYEPYAIYSNTHEFLTEKGYEVVETPENEDIVGYRTQKDDGTYIYPHFGLWQDGKVISKFASAHVYRHDIEKVPADYGNEVAFFRKRRI